MNNENQGKNLEKSLFDFRKVEKESEERKVIQKVKEKAAKKEKVIDPLVEEILRLQVKREKLDTPALVEQLDAQIQRLKDARRAGWKKEEK